MPLRLLHSGLVECGDGTWLIPAYQAPRLLGACDAAGSQADIEKRLLLTLQNAALPNVRRVWLIRPELN